MRLYADYAAASKVFVDISHERPLVRGFFGNDLATENKNPPGWAMP
jgi:hypothetical protein